MINISIMDVPLLLDTATDSSQFLHQWCRLYEFGIQMYPVFSVTVCLLYVTAVLGRRSAGRSDWRVLAAAAALTLVMIPFTLLHMQPTIDAIFGLRKLDLVDERVSLEEVRTLVVKWQWQHVVRSMFPLAGSALGFLGASGKVVF